MHHSGHIPSAASDRSRSDQWPLADEFPAHRAADEPYLGLIALSALIVLAAIGLVGFNHIISRLQDRQALATAEIIDLISRQAVLSHQAAAEAAMVRADLAAPSAQFDQTLAALMDARARLREVLPESPELDEPAAALRRTVDAVVRQCDLAPVGHPHADPQQIMDAAGSAAAAATVLIHEYREQTRQAHARQDTLQLINECALVLSFGLLLSVVLVPALRRAGAANALLAQQAEQVERLSLVAKLTKNAVIITDRHRRITWTNPAFTQITGYSAEEVLGKVPGTLLQSNRTDPAAVALLRDRLKQGQAASVEILNRGKFGREYWLDIEIQPIHNAQGELVGFIAIESEITARHEAEARIGESERRLSSIITAMAEGIVVQDAQGQIIEANPQAERVLGLTRDQILGRNCIDPRWRAIHDDGSDFPGTDHPAMRTLRTGQAQRGVVMGVHHPNRDLRWISINSEPIRTPQGEVVAVVCSFSDITEQRANQAAILTAKEAAEAASRAKSEFLANMSHEIRTPMTAILGYADLIAGGELDPQLVLDATETIRRNGQHLLGIINDILDLSKIEAGKLNCERIPTDPATLARDVVELLRPRAQGQGITLNLCSSTPIPRSFLCDPVRLRQVLMNIVGNAIKFTQVGGVRVDLSFDPAAPAGPTLRIDVRDTGIGMTAEQLTRVFSPFAQADNSTTRRFGGTGLGLAISQRLAQMLGGDITVTSQPDRGSTFTITIPTGPLDQLDLTPAIDSSRPQPLARPSTAVRPLAGSRVLLAEDGPDNQRLISFYLRQAGADVTVVDNGRRALDAVLAAGQSPDHPPFHLVLMDMQMPEMNGYEATRALRGAGVRTPVIALTAHAMAGDRDKCIAAGCDDYATKPIDRSALIAVCTQRAQAA